MKLTQQKTITRAVKNELDADMGFDRKPYFCPLTKENFHKKRNREHGSEIRPNNHRGWNTKNIFRGREIEFSLGYGKQRRLSTLIKGIAITDDLEYIGIDDEHIKEVERIYPNATEWLVAYV